MRWTPAARRPSSPSLARRTRTAAALTAQRALQQHQWPEGAAVRVRMGLHTGEPVITESGYVGMDVHRAARTLIGNNLPPGIVLLDLGEHRRPRRR